MSTRLALGVIGGAVPVVAVALFAASTRGGDGDGAVPIDPSVPTSVWDALMVVLLAFGLAVLIAIFIVQFGGPRAPLDRTKKRRLLGTVLTVALFMAAMSVLPPAEETVDDTEVDADLNRASGTGEEELPPPPDDTRAASEPDSGAFAGLMLSGALFLAGGLWWWSTRSGGPLDRPEDEVDPHAEERDLLRGLLDDAIARLRADPDPRRAVISTWARLEVALGAADLARHDAETPFAYLGRVLTALDASGPAVRRLTELFERAMFSPHAIGPGAQSDAVDALVAVRDELRVGIGTR